MTNKQAIEKLNDIRCHVKETSTEEQALVMAINALEAQLSQEDATKDTTSDLISRQEAIDALAKQMPTPYTPDGSHPADEGIFQVQEVYADCIETLELLPPAQPEERTKKRTETHACDLISRSAVYDRVSRIVSVNHLDPEKVWFTPIGVKALIKEMPPAQPERKTGHWILYDKRFPWRRDYKCSECGNYLDFSGVNAGRGDANYCPNCGARMKGEVI